MSKNKGHGSPWNDPQAAREAERYENPVPSRELILSVLVQNSKPLTLPQLCGLFELREPDQEEAMRRRLGAMVRDGQLSSNRRGAFMPVSEDDLVKGRVSGHPDGFGFLVPEDKSPDLLLTSREMRQVFDGDEVLARVTGYDHKGRREAQIVRVVKRKFTSIVGRYFEEGGVAFVLPDNPRITHEIAITGDTAGARIGQFVNVEIVEPPTHRSVPVGRVIEVLGDYMAPGMEIDIALRSHGIPHVWPEAVEAEVAHLKPEVLEADKQARVDLRNLPLVTIDGEDAKDFDDAVYVERRRGGFRLIVAIADVSHYVRPDSALDKEAQHRGNSVYFPEFVVPMLPEVLSNGLCSLNPHVDRLCMVCDMNISLAGRVTAYQFYPAVMHSHARFTYTKVAALLQEPESDTGRAVAESHPQLVKPLQELYELYKVLREAREKRGALDFDSQETRIMFSPERKIERIVPVVRNDAHKLIEECMLAANVCAADFVEKQAVPALFRNHQGPRDEKLGKLRGFLGALGINFTATDKPQPKDFHDVIEKIQDRPDKHIIETMLLRSLSQAYYGPENLGHFGLHYAAYAHFTSPIRRYPDLLLHRALRVAFSKPREIFPYSEGDMVALGEQCSMTERRADEATRDVVAWLKCEYMQDRVGEDFDGLITAVTQFGFFVELKDIFVEGLVHISNLGGDYYVYDASRQRLEGESTRIGFSLGDTVRVKVAGVNLDERKIDFQLVGGGSERKAGRSARERLASGELLREGKSGGKGKSGAPAKGAGKKPSGGKPPARKGKPGAAPKAGGKKKPAKGKR